MSDNTIWSAYTTFKDNLRHTWLSINCRVLRDIYCSRTITNCHNKLLISWVVEVNSANVTPWISITVRLSQLSTGLHWEERASETRCLCGLIFCHSYELERVSSFHDVAAKPDVCKSHLVQGYPETEASIFILYVCKINLLIDFCCAVIRSDVRIVCINFYVWQ